MIVLYPLSLSFLELKPFAPCSISRSLCIRLWSHNETLHFYVLSVFLVIFSLVCTERELENPMWIQ